ncbi:gasdermin-E [Pseudophryne corroboree]|uniref:gasdermin-E n=1 Tax=Pseudophryne corroboree TaxID=495146 RepID=UPI0030813895
MFAKATRNFLRDIDSGGELITVSSLNDSDKAQILSVVAKKRRFWHWQKPKYHFSSCACLLSDILTGESTVQPVVIESEFVKYEGKCGDVVKGDVDAEFGVFHGNAGGSGRVDSQSSFGTLRKQEVDMQHLMKDVQDRIINLHHPFIRQLHENKNDILCILKEKIVTTQKCIISEHTQTEEKFGGNLGVKAKTVKVTVTENGNVTKDENTVLELPASTTIAYGVVELYIKCDGSFEFCLLSEKEGGFEKETSQKHQHAAPVLYDTLSLYDWDVVDGFRSSSVDGKPVPGSAALSVLKQELLELRKHFVVFQELAETQRRELYNLLCEILDDGETVAQLQAVVEEICLGRRPSLTSFDELKPPQRERAQEILHFAGYDMQNEKLPDPSNRELLAAVHILISALDEMPDPALAMLGACSKRHLLPALYALPNITSDEGLCSRAGPLLSDLIHQGTFHIVQRLFSLSNVRMEENGESISAVTAKDPGFLPLILYISISGFHSLEKHSKN